MSDDTTMTGTSTAPADGAAAPVTPAAGGIKGFFASTLGRVLLIGCAVSTLLGIIAVVAVIALGVFAAKEVTTGLQSAMTNAPVTGAVPATSSAQPTTAVPAIPTIDNRDVFTPRDPFEPIPAPLIPTETVSGSSVHDDILVLVDIVTESGVRKAVLRYNGTQYTLAAGGQVGDTPWRVFQVNAGSVVMIYGDDRVTLTVGQGISK